METVKNCATCALSAAPFTNGQCRTCSRDFSHWEPGDLPKAPGVGHALGAGKGERQTFPRMTLEEKKGLHEAILRATQETPPKVTSTGGSTSYYKLPEGATDLQDLIEHKGMSFGRGNIFKASYRLGEKDAATEAYDLRKIIWFAQRRLAELGEDA